jgi:hypothetical protein
MEAKTNTKRDKRSNGTDRKTFTKINSNSNTDRTLTKTSKFDELITYNLIEL